MSEQVYHIPALLPETLAALDVQPGGTYIDATFGGGGHSRAILEQLEPGEGRLFSFDQDIEAIERTQGIKAKKTNATEKKDTEGKQTQGIKEENATEEKDTEGKDAIEAEEAKGIEALVKAQEDARLTLVHGNFRFMANFMRYYGVMQGQVDGILADLGVSFHHFDDPKRGFSFRWNGPLDMRMNQRAPRTAAQLLAQASEEELADIFYLYGEMKNARKLAATIVRKRMAEPIDTVDALLAVIKPMINPRQEKKELAQVFQALRIAVNNELDALKQFLMQAQQMLRPGGRLAIITYHSLEDRLVKNFIKTGNMEGKAEQDFYGRSLAPMKLLNSKPIVPSEEEIERNPRSRSAKLRVGVKL